MTMPLKPLKTGIEVVQLQWAAPMYHLDVFEGSGT